MVAPSTYKMFIREKYFTITKLGRGQWGTGVAEARQNLEKSENKKSKLSTKIFQSLITLKRVF